jgi:hypothetical protein
MGGAKRIMEENESKRIIAAQIAPASGAFAM